MAQDEPRADQTDDQHSDTEDSSASMKLIDHQSSDGNDDNSNNEAEKLEWQEEVSVFDKAREYLRPSFFFRWVISMYAQRKMVVFFLIHMMSTLVIWAHFAMIKFDQQMEAVPDTANKAWLKRLVPTIEFGSMHAILFQMALLPLTMCRYSIAGLSESFLSTVVPLNRTLGMHIHLGVVMILIIFLATIVFFGFFGFMCVHEGEQPFCDKFTMEIMITGYCILGSMLLVGVTSFLRHRIPYEVFYGKLVEKDRPLRNRPLRNEQEAHQFPVSIPINYYFFNLSSFNNSCSSYRVRHVHHYDCSHARR